MELIKIVNTLFANGEPKYSAGEYHPPNAELELCVSKGDAERVEVIMTPEEAETHADKALAKAVKAVAAADEANAMAVAAAAASTLPEPKLAEAA